jgi:hypothetical protein
MVVIRVVTDVFVPYVHLDIRVILNLEQRDKNNK